MALKGKNRMSKAGNRSNKMGGDDPIKRVSGAAKKNAKHNKRVDKKRSKDKAQLDRSGNKKRFTRKSGKKSRTYKI